MRLIKHIAAGIFLLFICQLLISCSGCSQSGMRNRAEKKSDRNSDYLYPSPEKENKTESKSISDLNRETDNKAGNTLTSLFKENKSAVFMIYTSDGDEGRLGSGFFISADGIGVSNYHVFEGTSKGLEVIKLESGRELKIATILATSEDDDYIVFKVNTINTVNYLNISPSLPEIGEEVFAIGNPEGLEHTLSTGIISGYRDNNRYIQTTTEITHGSSGGPLINMKGEVVGITTSGLGQANLNFAINIRKLNLSKYISQSSVLYQSGHSFNANVKRVIDGGTFALDTDGRVRLIGTV